MSKNTATTAAKFGRFQDVQAQYGIKRGTAYNLIEAGLIKAKKVTIDGRRGIVLVDLASVAAFIRSQPAA